MRRLARILEFRRAVRRSNRHIDLRMFIKEEPQQEGRETSMSSCEPRNVPRYVVKNEEKFSFDDHGGRNTVFVASA